MNLTISYILLSVCLLSTATITTPTHNIQSMTKKQHFYSSSYFQSSELYAVKITRTSSNQEEEYQKCHSSSKEIVVKKQQEIFRVKGDKSEKRQQTIFTKITTLDDNQNMIEEFELIGNETFLVYTNGKGYFLNNGQQTEVDTKLNLSSNAQTTFFNVIIIDFNERALIVSSNGISLCRSDQKLCVLIDNFEKLPNLYSAKLFTEDAINYLFLMCGDKVVIYEITAGSLLKNRVEYSSEFFKTNGLHIRNMIKDKTNNLLFLDSRKGIIQTNYDSKMSNLKNPVYVYDQPGCYQITANANNLNQVLLTCTLASKSFFLRKIKKSNKFSQTHYQEIETIFTSQRIFDSQFTDNFIMSRVYSGVRFYWTSSNVLTPYPYEFNNAGTIFLHNALQSKLKTLNGQQVIYISTQDQLRMFRLKILNPYVWCYSTTQVEEDYQLVYSFPCSNPIPQRICQYNETLQYKSWKQGQVKITTMLIPLGFSFMGLAIIIYIVFRIYKKYQNDIQRARLTYNSQNQFGV